MANQKINSFGKLFLKLFFTVLAFYIIYQKVELKQVFEMMKQVNIFYLGAVLFLFNLGQITSALRQRYIFTLINVTMDKLSVIKLYYIGMFYNTFLPGGVGGDGYKVYYLKKHYDIRVKEGLASMLIDRGSGLAALFFLAGILYLFSSFAIDYLDEIAVVSLIALFPLYYLVIKRFFKRYLEGVIVYTYQSFIVHFIQLLAAFFLVLAIGSDHYIDFLTLFFISSVVAIIPISFGGVGLRELTFIYGFSLLGVDQTAGVTFAFVFFLITLFSSLIGIVFRVEKSLPLENKTSN